MPVEWMTYDGSGVNHFTFGNASTASSGTYWGNYDVSAKPILWFEPEEEEEPDEPALWELI